MENNTGNDRLEIIETKKILDVKRASIEDSRFEILCLWTVPILGT